MSYKIDRCWVRLAKETTPAGFVNPREIPTGAVEVVAERIGISAAGFRSAQKLFLLSACILRQCFCFNGSSYS